MSPTKEASNPAAPSYHRLTVKAVREETAEAKSFVLAPEAGEATFFRYKPGQFLTFRIPHDSGTIIRSYSLSSAPGADPDMTVCVKRITDGRGSNWFNDHLTAGVRIDAMQPAGRFVMRDSDAPLLLIAGGSGITPCLSLIKQALIDTAREVKLIYINQHAAAIIYRGMLDRLDARFSDRFTCQHWLDDTGGLITAPDIAAAANGWALADSYICGPGPLMNMAEETLGDLFGAETVILTERFVSPDDPEDIRAEPGISTPSETAWIESFKLTLDGKDHVIPMTAGETLLQAALAAGIDAPNSCTEGHCGTCMARLRQGEVSMISTRALSKRNIQRGYVLACQATPSSPTSLWLDFDL